MTTKSTPHDRIDAELIALHEAYVRQVNAAVSAGRDALAQDLAQDFQADADELLVRGRA
ncbi:MAG: hypothetical protein JWP14_51 [Frankiales bacterium]|nr:hypothetical protein [Frankiales bacterium]